MSSSGSDYYNEELTNSDNESNDSFELDDTYIEEYDYLKNDVNINYSSLENEWKLIEGQEQNVYRYKFTGKDKIKNGFNYGDFITPYDSFFWFFDREIIDFIVTETNSYGYTKKIGPL